MPLVHTRVFRVRHYECGPDGNVRKPVYLRYAQETAFDASAAAGYGLPRYASMNRIWLARETEVEFLSPLFYGDSVEVVTWVMDFRRVRSRRAYDFRRPGSGELIARASTDWVFLHHTTGRPAQIPDQLKQAFFPEGIPEEGAALERLPRTPPAPAAAIRQRRQVEWRDLDPVGHVNNAIYLSFALGGLALIRDERHGNGDDVPASLSATRYHRIEYLQPAVLGDTIEVASWSDQDQGDGALCHTLIERANDGERLARVRSILAS